MSEPITVPADAADEAPAAEVTVAEKRAKLQEAGFPVGTRGKLSAEAEARYAELVANA